MDRMSARSERIRRENRIARVLMVVAAVVLIAGLVAQITVRARIFGQNKQIAEIQRDIHTMNANAENLNLYINQYHNLTAIGQRAEMLGMEKAAGEQLRYVNLPVIGDTSAQTVVNSDGEEMIG